MTVQYDSAQMSVTGAPGTGSVTLASATTNSQSFAQAGAQNGDIMVVRFDTGSSFEVRECAYASAGPTLTRGVLLDSTTGSTVSLGSDTICTIVSTKRDNPDPIFASFMGAP